MAKEKIAIIGGGFGGLTTAWQLTRTQALRDRYEVSVSQMGWRLGGKCATGRDHQGRILEHGLHFWFGCYDNAWAMLKEIYQAWEKPPGCPFQTGLDAFEAQNYTPIGERRDGSPGFFRFTWPTNTAKRGDGHVFLSFFEMLSQIMSLIRLMLGRDDLRDRLDDCHQLLRELATLSEDEPSYESAHRGFSDSVLGLREAHAGTRDDVPPVAEWSPVIDDAIHIALTVVRGVGWDCVFLGKSLDELNAVEFRDWLEEHGADHTLVRSATIVRSIYDTCFWYVDGDPQRPDVGTGTALRVILRIVATYKESVMFTLKAGMAEAVIAPMYEVLQQRGVTFRFFRKARFLHLDATKTKIESITFDRQADMVDGGDYRPTRVIGGLVTWPAEPFWDQLVDGDRLQRDGVNFESNWCREPPRGSEVLQLGRDFDRVILAVSLGAYKPLAAGVTGLCDDLLAESRPLARMANGIGIVPTYAVQAWSNRTLAELGWDKSPATVAGAEALSIWADMSQLLSAEPPPSGEPAKSVHYLCGVLDTRLFKEPPTAFDTPQRALTLATGSTQQWFDAYGLTIWPEARTPDGAFDASVISYRYVRANIDPTECCVGAAAGEVGLRLPTDGSGFSNLHLAGCYIRTGLDTTCVESAVMSGMQASRSISGSPASILGEKFIR